MNLTRNCWALMLAVVTGSAAAPKEAVDPATLKDKVTISVGKKLVIRFEQDGNTLSGPKVVDKAGEEPPTPSFDFRKMDEMLILATKNPFPKDMKFRALARLKGRDDYFETSIVPVKSGLLGFELWQDPIEELVLFEFRLIDAKP